MSITEHSNEAETNEVNDSKARRPSLARRLSAPLKQWVRGLREKSDLSPSQARTALRPTARTFLPFSSSSRRVTAVDPSPRSSTSSFSLREMFPRLRSSVLRGTSPSTRPSSAASTATQPWPEYIEVQPQERFAGTIPYAARPLEAVEGDMTDPATHHINNVENANPAIPSCREIHWIGLPPGLQHPLNAGHGRHEYEAITPQRLLWPDSTRAPSGPSISTHPFSEYPNAIPRSSFVDAIRGWEPQPQSDQHRKDQDTNGHENANHFIGPRKFGARLAFTQPHRNERPSVDEPPIVDSRTSSNRPPGINEEEPNHVISSRHESGPREPTPHQQPPLYAGQNLDVELEMVLRQQEDSDRILPCFPAATGTQPFPENTDVTPSSSFANTGRGWQHRCFGSPETTNEDNTDLITSPSEPSSLPISTRPSMNTGERFGETPGADEVPGIDDSPIVNETPSFEETPAIDETPVVDETPGVNATAVVNAISISDDSTIIDDSLVIDNSPIINRSPTLNESPNSNNSQSSSDTGSMYWWRHMQMRAEYYRRRAEYLRIHGEDAEFPPPPRPARINEHAGPAIF